MINLWLRGCLRVRLSPIKGIVSKPLSLNSCRCFCYHETKQLTKIDKNKEITGYFQEDFNVKGQAFWELSTRVMSFGIVYVVTSITAAIASFYVFTTVYTLDLILDLELMDFLSYFNLPDDVNPRKILTIGLYFMTEPVRLYLAYRLSGKVRNLLYSRKFFKDPKFRRFKGEKNYDEEKIGRF